MKEKYMDRRYIQVVTLAIILMMLLPAHCWSASEVSGHYSSSSGKQVSLVIKIGSPAPKSLIVTQKVPAGTTIIKSKPPYKKLNKNNQAKWLLNNLKPGTSTISIQLDKAVKTGEVKATLRYRNKQTGEMTSMKIGN